MTLPARALYLHHTVTQVTPHPYADMRVVEAEGVRRFGHISYSYVIHPDGTTMEGCGTRRGAHTEGRNSTAFGVALIGNYDQRNVTAMQLDAVRWLVAALVEAGNLRPGIYPTGGHRDVKATACPGAKAYRLLDAMRIPWTIQNQETPMADNPDLPNIEGPLQLVVVADQAGQVTGYYIFSTSTGELHAHPHPDHPGKVRYLGRSEDLTPD
jgi:hypothetical protein